jgi:Skp family chaperone for outer membrane proteins
MKHYGRLAGWARALAVLATLAFFVAFTLIGAVAVDFPSLAEGSKALIDWCGNTIAGWVGLALVGDLGWLYADVKVCASAVGIVSMAFSFILFSRSLRGYHRAYARKAQTGQTQASSTVVIGSSDESRRLAKEQAKLAEKETKMKKLDEIRAEKKAKKEAKKAAKLAAKEAKAADKATATEAKKEDKAVEAVAKAAEAPKKASSSKNLDDILNSMK